jgi:hypothetical protein
MLSPFHHAQQFRKCASILARFQRSKFPYKLGVIHRRIFSMHRPLLNRVYQAPFDPPHQHTFFLPDAVRPDSKRATDSNTSGRVT